MSSVQATRNGTRGGVGNFTKEETVHLLRIVEWLLPIGTEGWKTVETKQSENSPSRCKNALMRKYSTLQQKKNPTGNPNMPEEVRLTKRFKHLIGDKAFMGDADEEFNLEEVGFGESGANPNPEAGIDTDAPPYVTPTSNTSETPVVCGRNFKKSARIEETFEMKPSLAVIETGAGRGSRWRPKAAAATKPEREGFRTTVNGIDGRRCAPLRRRETDPIRFRCVS
eukprot:CAMPEP_0197178980 /NCGR_PEP_ID=MMETSP1423-20130617/4081_1 /TAXON_ID=476441 /ORGANISM="Pseudo-nitzschia heimii, Strain UNC1101" /LENGTH=224 /DNA_ID=CAMNT_0042628813 /DNA_START=109 /DNA_END=780 /DNA_ORIENTATION=+